VDLARNLIGRINVGDSLTRTAASKPDQLAVVDGDRRFTYAGFNAYVNRLAHGLAARGYARADALALAHSRQVLHCDIKPSNVLIAPNGRVVLLDFGLVADWVPPDAADVQAELVGSLGYLAPERFAGSEGHEPGHAIGALRESVGGPARRIVAS